MAQGIPANVGGGLLANLQLAIKDAICFASMFDSILDFTVLNVFVENGKNTDEKVLLAGVNELLRKSATSV